MSEVERSFVVVITGPESCGKSSLASDLSEHFNGDWIPEYARSYIEGLKRPYTYEDVEQIAQYQIQQFKKQIVSKHKNILFFDTYLIITKVWFTHVYKRYPEWLETAIRQSKVDLFLLCYPDLPWISDAVRENGHIREYLFQKYKDELQHYGFEYVVVSGSGEERKNKAIEFINLKIKQNNLA